MKQLIELVSDLHSHCLSRLANISFLLDVQGLIKISDKTSVFPFSLPLLLDLRIPYLSFTSQANL